MTDTFTHNGREFQMTIEHDEVADAPWDREDGHGPVSDWKRGGHDHNGKAPGELILHHGRCGFRTYDFAEACRIAREERWGAPGDSGMTPRQKAAHDARADFERLRAWCNHQWSYVGVVVTALDSDGEPTGETESLWGIESDDYGYHETVARELADEIAARLDTEMAAEIAASRPDMTMQEGI